MEKIKLKAISNREDHIILTLEKNKTYYPFLFKLLKEFNQKIPDLQDYMGNNVKISEIKDSYMHYGNESFKLLEVIGSEKIFLIILTDLKNKLSDFIEKNCEFIKNEKIKC